MNFLYLFVRGTVAVYCLHSDALRAKGVTARDAGSTAQAEGGWGAVTLVTGLPGWLFWTSVTHFPGFTYSWSIHRLWDVCRVLKSVRARTLYTCARGSGEAAVYVAGGFQGGWVRGPCMSWTTNSRHFTICVSQRIFLQRGPSVWVRAIKIKMKFAADKITEEKNCFTVYLMPSVFLFTLFCSFLRCRLIQTWIGQRTDLWFVDRSGKLTSTRLLRRLKHSFAGSSPVVSPSLVPWVVKGR